MHHNPTFTVHGKKRRVKIIIIHDQNEFYISFWFSLLLPELTTPDTPAPCDSQPCLNGGTCSYIEDVLECSCRVGFTGDRCETGKQNCQIILTPSVPFGFVLPKHAKCSFVFMVFDLVCNKKTVLYVISTIGKVIAGSLRLAFSYTHLFYDK